MEQANLIAGKYLCVVMAVLFFICVLLTVFCLI